MWKYILKQPDCKPGNEEIIARRLLDNSVEDPFDLSHVMPADSGIQFVRRFFECLEPRHVVIEKVVGTSSEIFGNFRKSSENRRECSEIPVLTGRKPHAFDSEIVGRYTAAYS